MPWHVVITGASKGVGSALARELIQRGYRVTSIARTGALLEAQAREIGTHPVPLDLADLDACEGLLERIESDRGPIDVLINNAAHPGAGALHAVSSADLRAALTVNLLAPMELARQGATLMRGRGSGHIVTVSSVAAGMVLRNSSMYTISKGALTQLSYALGQELEGSGVRVTLIALGIVRGTELLELAHQDPVMARTGSRFARLPSLTPEQAARGIADALPHAPAVAAMPRFYEPFVRLRRLPVQLSALLTR